MINIWFDEATKKFIIETDDLSTKYFLETTTTTREFVPWKKQYGVVKRNYKIYDKKKTVDGKLYFQVGMGWAGYLTNTFSPYITKQCYDDIIKSVMTPIYRTQPFPELRDYQNEDVLHILKFRVGLFSCYTSYGNQKICRVI